MSHRDKDCPTRALTNAQELSAAIQGVLGKTRWSVQLRKGCGWSVLGLITAALVWACSGQGTLTGRFGQALKFARGLGRRFAPVKTSYQAFMKLLVRWTADLRKDIVLEYHLLMEREFPDQFRIAGYVLLGGDGSKLQLARTRSNEARYCPAKTRAKKGKNRRKTKRRKLSRQARAKQARDKKADSPQMALTLLHHLALRLPWDWRLGPYDASERQQLLDRIPHLPPDALVVADCGFYGYEFWSALLASKRQFVIRVGGNVRLLKKLGVARETNGTVYVWPDKVAKRKQPPLVLRLVEVHDGRQSWYLVTSVLDPDRLSDQQVAQIYGYRWRIELFFRHFKQTYGRAKLRSHKGEHAECEAEWSLLGLWTMLLHARLQLPDKDPGRLSVARVLRAFAQALDHYKWRPEPGESLAELLSQAIIDPYRRRDKTSRDYPRKKYERPAGAPRILKATVTQRQTAQKLMAKVA
jgi:Transposase DDE domain